MAILTGLVTPLLINIILIKEYLKYQLLTGLRESGHSNNDVEVEFIRKENSTLSINQLGVSLLLLGFGIASFYFLPKALLEPEDLSPFFGIVSGILYLLILGLIFVA